MYGNVHVQCGHILVMRGSAMLTYMRFFRIMAVRGQSRREVIDVLRLFLHLLGRVSAESCMKADVSRFITVYVGLWG